MVIDMTVVNLDEMKKAMPNEYSGAGKRVSFQKLKRCLRTLDILKKRTKSNKKILADAKVFIPSQKLHFLVCLEEQEKVKFR